MGKTPGERSFGTRPSCALRQSHSLAKWFGMTVWFFAALGLTGLGTLVVMLMFGGPFGLGGPLGLLVLVVTVAIVVVRLRRQRVRVILSYLEQAVRLNLPLSPFLRAAASSERGQTALRLLELERVLAAGGGLGEGLAATVPECSTRVAAVVAAAERTGQLPAALRRVVREEAAAREPSVDRAVYARVYPLVLVLFCGGLMTGMMVFVVPKFREIFADFRIQGSLPPVTQGFINFSDWMCNDWGWFCVVPPIILIFLCLLGMYVRTIFFVERGPGLLQPIVDRVLWVVPGWHSMARDRGLADVCQYVGDALPGGATAQLALDSAADLPDNAVLRSRIVRWREGVERGMSLGAAAEAARLPALLVGLLSTGETAGNVPEALRFLARYYRVRFSRVFTLIIAAAEPLMILVLGTLVGLIVVALFQPIVALLGVAYSGKAGL